MAETRIGLLKAIYRSGKARLFTFIPIAAAAYQFCCDQFGFPTIPNLWGMTGAIVPWWGWLLLAQVGAVYGLFEYVRLGSLALKPSAKGPVDIRTVAARLEKSKKPEPDITLTEVGLRVVQALGPAPTQRAQYQVFERKVNLAIADKIKLKKLTIWGRFADFGIEPFDDRDLDHMILDFSRNELRVPHQWNTNTYTDIGLVKAEIDQIWPPGEASA